MNDVNTRCDLAMGGITITAERSKNALFSAPYLRDGKAAAVRCGDAANTDRLPTSTGRGSASWSTPAGTNAEFDEANLKNATVVGYPDNNTIFDRVIDGKADAMITDASEIRWQQTQHPQLCGVGLDHPFTSSEKAYLIPRAGVATQKRVDEWLDEVTDDGTYATAQPKVAGTHRRPMTLRSSGFRRRLTQGVAQAASPAV